MNEDIIAELDRRAENICKNSEPGEVGTGMSGSMLRFQMAMSLVGYPFEPYDWMDEDHIKPLLSKDDFYDNKWIDAYIETLFISCLRKVNGSLLAKL